MCEYKFRNGAKCKEEALPNSKYCILHVDLPEDEEGEEFKRINELKEEKVKEKVNSGDFNFEGAKLFEVDFTYLPIDGDLIFDYGVILKNALFAGAGIGGTASFRGTTIKGDALFDNAGIKGYAWFDGATIKGNASFFKAKLKSYASFNETAIKGYAVFDGATIERRYLYSYPIS